MRRVRDDKEMEVSDGRRPNSGFEIQETGGIWTPGVDILGLSMT